MDGLAQLEKLSPRQREVLDELLRQSGQDVVRLITSGLPTTGISATAVTSKVTAHEHRSAMPDHERAGGRGTNVFKSPQAWLWVNDDEAKLVLVNQVQPMAKVINLGDKGPGTLTHAQQDEVYSAINARFGVALNPAQRATLEREFSKPSSLLNPSKPLTIADANIVRVASSNGSARVPAPVKLELFNDAVIVIGTDGAVTKRQAPNPAK
jgi:hypothetical protein